MSVIDSNNIRNLALIGPSGAGKTALVEALLHEAGAIEQKGSLGAGTMVSDHSDLEAEHGHSLDTSLCHFETDGTRVHVIDTPGAPDFLGRSISVLPAVETAALVLSAQGGIETGVRRLFEAARDAGLCRLIVINKIDLDPKGLPGLLANVQEVFGNRCLPVNLPAEGGSRVRDVFFSEDGGETDFSSVHDAHTEIMDQVVEMDEELMETYLESGQNLNPGQVHDAFEKALRNRHLIPVCFVSAETGAGVPELMRLIRKLLPNPSEGIPPKFMKGEGDQAERAEVRPDPEAHAIAHVFKIVVDPYAGRMGAFRIHQGTIRTGGQLFIGDARKPFKVTHLYRIQGKDLTEIDAGVPGDICAVTRVEGVHYDDVLHDSHDEDHYHLQSPKRPPPMMGLAVEPLRRGDEQKLSEAIQRIASEDPCLVVEHRANTNETVILGTGELHLRLVLQAMKDRFGVEAETHPPTIPYRETITGKADGHHRHKKQTGGAGQFGEVFLRIEPLPRGDGLLFENAVVGGAIPTQFIAAVEKGVRQAMEEGAVAGFPLQDVKVTVYDGKHHSVDSKEVAFVAAARKALLDAVAKAGPIILEPLIEMHVSAPVDATGAVTGDLSSRRGRVLGSTMLGTERVQIDAEAPLSELQDYPSSLKAMTGGAGTYTMALSRYEAVPARVQQELSAASARDAGTG
jgi:elongation factor G